ncbi:MULTISPECIES: Crp/Fnr family transcriptional regulator [Methylobacterium]|jgi:CRP-like cAMP-binding protein|uniref:Regulation and Cell signaling n=3 Tax=Methylobacterium TaxID=407 RepID=A0AAE8L7H8_9HYPH|nr:MULTISPECIES: Crp/Fnr family transcriptional regulator [Methylobacterium]KOX52342.1 Crp/Fnr family transcriptional regulator [Streptomyces purpurogeneiscleroticus]AIQ91074.1 Crp/Fnr family transcriptional regulator [Methylobacterium oryzae CBMB20]APT31681.1 regulation and Cell signaling [Methylobacterium phyllosphaerae]AWV16998.1 Crp/Fnr family transcriptional regulator [Methylobacterium sp. XJLW]MBA9062027.1 CRP-like cAMP-binding protein [Methylobacterium fujisawaense]
MFETPHQASRQPFLRRIETVALFTLSDAERAALVALPMQVAQFEPNQDIVREGDRPTRSFTLLSGIACTYKSTLAGKRQVMTYHVPGDVPDFQSLYLEVLDINIATVSACRLGFVSHEAVRGLMRAHPRLTEVFWRATLIDAALVREWMLNTGRRDAYARMAHLFCELVTRLGAVGLAPDRTCELPMTQPELADALGITSVHVNRTIRDLKSAGLITLRDRRLTVHDWPGLQAAAGFDPAYLHLRDAETR